MPLSLCMIAKNEAQHIARALASVADLADEMIVLDTGSDDATRRIAADYGAKVIAHEWKDDFAEARNASLRHASSEWVLVLDADEELLPQSREPLADLLEHGTADAYWLRIRNLAAEGEMHAFTEARITRLFRNRPAFRYEGRIHEQVRPAIERHGGEVESADVILLHHGYAETEVQGGVQRAQRNLDLLRGAIDEQPGDPYLHYQLGVTLKADGRDDQAYQAFHRALELGIEEELSADGLAMMHVKVAQLALSRDDYPTAARFAVESLKLEGDLLLALYTAGVALMYMNRPQDACPLLKRARAHPHLREAEQADLDKLLAFCSAL